jgi:hypothetical protein
MLNKAMIVGIILLFNGITIQPTIADVSIEPDDSELVEITVEIYEVNSVQEYTVMLTKEHVEELELLINNTKTELHAAGDSDETENIFMKTVSSLNKLGLLPNSMSVEEVQRIVRGEKQNPRLVKFFERYYSKNQKSLDNNDNIFCLIAGKSINTVFIAPIALSIFIYGASFIFRYLLFWKWFRNISPEIFSFYEKLNYFREAFWCALGAGLNFLPFKIGAYIHYGWISFDYEDWYGWVIDEIPAKGWVSTYGISGKKQWSGDFSGEALGFTGIKIFTGFLDFFYFGAALRVKIEDE